MVQQPIQTRISADDYFELAEYAANDLIQLIDSEVIIGMLPILKHQEIVGEIFSLLRIIAKQKGGRAYIAPCGSVPRRKQCV